MGDEEYKAANSDLTGTGSFDKPAREGGEETRRVIEGIADKVSEHVAAAGDQASAAVEKVADGASSAYERAASGAHKAADTIEPLVQERPYAALGIAAGIGIVLGLLIAGRGPKVVYVRAPA